LLSRRKLDSPIT